MIDTLTKEEREFLNRDPKNQNRNFIFVQNVDHWHELSKISDKNTAFVFYNWDEGFSLNYEGVCTIFVINCAASTLSGTGHVEVYRSSLDVCLSMTAFFIHSNASITHSVRAIAHYSTIRCHASSQVEAHYSSVLAFSRSKITAERGTTVNASDFSQVIALQDCRVLTTGQVNVCAYDNSSVYAIGRSTVIFSYAWEGVAIIGGTAFATYLGDGDVSVYDTAMLRADHNGDIRLFDYSTLVGTATPTQVVATANIVNPLKNQETIYVAPLSAKDTLNSWLSTKGIAVNDGTVTLYKRVSHDFKTQEDTENETHWEIGKTLEVPNWNIRGECGEGKFHACLSPMMCLRYRDSPGDRWIAVQVEVNDIHIFRHPNFTDKVAFRKGKVLYEVDVAGKKIGHDRNRVH